MKHAVQKRIQAKEKDAGPTDASEVGASWNNWSPVGQYQYGERSWPAFTQALADYISDLNTIGFGIPKG